MNKRALSTIVALLVLPITACPGFSLQQQQDSSGLKLADMRELRGLLSQNCNNIAQLYADAINDQTGAGADTFMLLVADDFLRYSEPVPPSVAGAKHDPGSTGTITSGKDDLRCMIDLVRQELPDIHVTATASKSRHACIVSWDVDGNQGMNHLGQLGLSALTFDGPKLSREVVRVDGFQQFDFDLPDADDLPASCPTPDA